MESRFNEPSSDFTPLPEPVRPEGPFSIDYLMEHRARFLEALAGSAQSGRFDHFDWYIDIEMHRGVVPKSEVFFWMRDSFNSALEEGDVAGQQVWNAGLRHYIGGLDLQGQDANMRDEVRAITLTLDTIF